MKNIKYILAIAFVLVGILGVKAFATPIGAGDAGVAPAIDLGVGGEISIEPCCVIEPLDIDVTAPVITVTGTNPITVAQGSAYMDAGATAIDNVDGMIGVSASAFNTNTVGTFTITYTATDTAGNVATATRTIHVTDQTAPTIHVNGENPLRVARDSAYVDAGAVATDNVDATVVVSASPFNTDTVGTFTITYTATDLAGNTATATRTINVYRRSSGGSGGSYVPKPVIIAPVIAPVIGQVLGTTDFKFTTFLKKGMISSDVKELQDRLRIEGFFTLPVVSTDYFGVITLKAVKAYQKAHNINPTGFVGPLTIAELNK